MATRKSRFAWFGCAVVALLAGCASSNETATGCNPDATVGQQLIDLRRAYDLGALSQQTYERQREAILGKPRSKTSLAPGSPLNESVRTISPLLR
jgi:type IV pilus biogenesis protein CpaD/CtpE